MEWESEGATLFDVIDLIRLSERHSQPLFVKIGGYEAMRDLFDLYSLGIHGLIIPMVESAFGVKKALEAIDAVFTDESLSITLTIESVMGIEALPQILKSAHTRIERITIGRSDLGRSMGDTLKPNDPALIPLIEKVICDAAPYPIPVGVGGGVTANISLTLPVLDQLGYVETRHCIFSSSTILETPHLIDEALQFEQAWLVSRIARQQKQADHYRSRMTLLQNRHTP